MSTSPPAPRRGPPFATLALGLWLVVVAAFVILGSDLLWVVALGDLARSGQWVITDIPFASAPQEGWNNPILVAELILSLVHAAGAGGLAGLQLLVAAAVMGLLLAEGRRRGAGEGRIALVLSLVVVGSAAAVIITRLPSLSLVPYVVALALMRSQDVRRSASAWWLVPLFVLWGNLHGGVLVGLAVLGVWLVASPGAGSLGRRAALGLGAALSLVVTSAGLHTPAYYVSALGNEAARRGTDLWARPSLTNPLDVAMLLAAAVLLVLAARNRMRIWEWLAVAGLVVGTASAGRNGVWLVLFLAAAAMRPRRSPEAEPRTIRSWGLADALALGVSGALAVGVLAWRGGDAIGPPGADAVAMVADAARGRPVLADQPLAETLGQGGVTVWASNPIDAFPRKVQAAYLDFLHDGTPPPGQDIEVAAGTTAAMERLRAGGGWRELASGGGYVVLERSP